MVFTAVAMVNAVFWYKKPHVVTSQKTPFFMVIAVKTSKHTQIKQQFAYSEMYAF
jgi:hypothetical protein